LLKHEFLTEKIIVTSEEKGENAKLAVPDETLLPNGPIG
jgi:hypothetical protein